MKKPTAQDSRCYIDEDELADVFKTAKAHILAKLLGVKLPYRIAKKFYCRCGKVFVYPLEFLSHRAECKVILRDQALLDRAPKKKVIKVIKKEPVQKVKSTEKFPCRCGHIFPTKKMCNNHQKLCSILREAEGLFDRCKDYLERTKDLKDEHSRRPRKKRKR